MFQDEFNVGPAVRVSESAPGYRTVRLDLCISLIDRPDRHY